MSPLNKKALAGILKLVFGMAVLIFLPAGTFNYWQAWLFLAVFSASVVAITAYLARKDQALLKRRMAAGPSAEKEKSQQVIQILAQLSYISVIVVPAFDHRFGWSMAPASIVLAGDGLVALGLLIVFLAFKENTFAGGAIKVDDGQKVISTGPYALVRHPMYTGALIMLLGMPLALGSWWGVLTIAPMKIAILWRLLDEERFLVAHLPGYSEYRARVQYRLLPLVW
jgi:protein-S-isoprenylcysteine O-methyltransferase Ste14